MKLRTGLILSFLFLYSFAFAEEKDGDQRVFVYLHPNTLLGSLYLSAIFQEPNLILVLTGEIPLGTYNSIIINPSLLLLNWDIFDSEEIFTVGAGIGIRHYFVGKTKGFYMQLMPQAYYRKEKSTRDWGRVHSNLSGIGADILYYMGYSFKFSKLSLFFDAGLGAGYSRSSENSVADGETSTCKSKSFGPSFDLNMGIGIPVSAKK
jgi:hypothetical protein